MKVFWLTLRASASGLALPCVGALALCALCLYLNPHDKATGVDQTSGQWLHVAGLLLVAALLGAALEAWPLFSRARPGHEVVLRAQRQPLHGCLAAAAGGLCALAAALTLSAAAFFGLLRAFDVDQGEVHTRLPVELVEGPRGTRPFLDHEQHALRFRVRTEETAGHLTLRPDAFVTDRDMSAAAIEVSADGVPLHKGFLPNSGEPIRLVIEPPRRVHELLLRRRPGPGLVLRLQPDRVELISAKRRPGLANCMLAAWTYLLPAALAFAVMIAGHRHLAMPVNLAAGLVTCLLATLLGITPNSEAITHFARAEWLLGADGLDLQSLWSLAVAGLLTAVAWVAHRR